LFHKLKIKLSKPPTPPNWILNSNKFFGAYLAAIIDGDGGVRIKRYKYPQCVIRIISGEFPHKLSKAVERILRCSIYSEYRERTTFIGNRKISGKSYTLEFNITKKNIGFVKNFILPHIVSSHKSDKIKEFLIMKDYQFMTRSSSSPCNASIFHADH